MGGDNYCGARVSVSAWGLANSFVNDDAELTLLQSNFKWHMYSAERAGHSQVWQEPIYAGTRPGIGDTARWRHPRLRAIH
jgi:hypothetical protein